MATTSTREGSCSIPTAALGHSKPSSGKTAGTAERWQDSAPELKGDGQGTNCAAWIIGPDMKAVKVKAQHTD